MDKFVCADLALQHFNNKKHTLEYEEYAGYKIEFKIFEVQVAVFEEDFNLPPTNKTVRVRLSDDEYLLLLQWQLQNPATGFNACDGELSDIIATIECQVEDKIFGDNKVGTYAIYLSEIRQDVALILRNLEQAK